MKSYDVLVIGGGIIGGSIAFRLAQQNLSVALLDQQDFGREASWAAAGMLSPAPDSAADIPLVPFSRASLSLYPTFLEEVEEVSELSVHHRPHGAMQLLFSADAERRLSTLIALHHALGLPTEPLPLDEARKLEPALGREVRAAALLPNEASVDNRALTLAVLAAAAASDVTLIPNLGVTELLHDTRQCTGVIAGGESYAAGNVVLAAGAFSGKVAGLVARGSDAPNSWTDAGSAQQRRAPARRGAFRARLPRAARRCRIAVDCRGQYARGCRLRKARHAARD